jgi:hypothetical protein
MDVGIVTRAVPYILKNVRVIDQLEIFYEKSPSWTKIIFGFNWNFVLYSVLFKEEWNGFALNFTNNFPIN